MAPWTPDAAPALGPGEVAAVAEASAALARLDERLSAGNPAVAEGWLARLLIEEAAAAATLDDEFVDAGELLLCDAGALDRYAAASTGRAQDVLHMLRSAARRSPQQMFTPRRLMAMARLRHREVARRSQPPDWVRDRRAGGAAIAAALDAALDRDALELWGATAPLVGAALLLAHWHATRCDVLIGAAAGRALAAAWVRRMGLTRRFCLLPALGFRGQRTDYQPDLSAVWIRRFAEAARRGAERGLAAHAGLAQTYAAVAGLTAGRRSTSRLPALVELLAARPCVSALTAARALGITPTAASALLEDLRAARVPGSGRAAVRELTDRKAFRLYALG